MIIDPSSIDLEGPGDRVRISPGSSLCSSSARTPGELQPPPAQRRGGARERSSPVFSAPFIILRNTLRGRQIEGRRSTSS